MTDLISARLRLHLLTVDEAARVVEATPGDQDRWADDFPTQDDRDGVGAFLKAARAGADAGLFGCYRIDLDGAAVGTIGFFGPPDAGGEVMFGYGLVPGARGRGVATEAVGLLVELCRAQDAVRVMVADTDAGNTASQRVLAKSGFAVVKEEEGMIYYRLDVAGA